MGHIARCAQVELSEKGNSCGRTGPEIRHTGKGPGTWSSTGKSAVNVISITCKLGFGNVSGTGVGAACSMNKI